MHRCRRAVTLSLAAVLALACIAAAAVPAADAEPPVTTTIDPQVTALLKAVAETYKGMFSCQDTVDVVLTNRLGPKTEVVRSSVEFSLMRPNQMALRVRSDYSNYQVVSNGVTLWRYIQERGAYMKTAAPSSLDVLLLQPGPVQGLALQAFASRPYEILMKDVTGARHLGREGDGPQAQEHVRLYQSNATVDLWVGAGDRLIRRMQTVIEDKAKASSMVLEETHKPVYATGRLPAALFRFEPPAGTIEVESFGADMLLNKALPALSVRDVQRQNFSLRDTKGWPLAITFWHSSVPASLDVLKAVDGLHADYGKRVLFLAVNLKEKEDAVAALARQLGLGARMALDPAGELAMRLGVQVAPTVFIVDPSGVVCAVFPSGRALPRFELRDVQHWPLKLSDAGHRPMVLAFWRTDAPNAGELLAALDNLTAELGDKAVFVAVNVQEPEAGVAAYAQARGLKMRMGLDPDGKTAARLNVAREALPAVLIVDPRGQLCAMHTLGPDTPQKLIGQVRLEIAVLSRVIGALQRQDTPSK